MDIGLFIRRGILFCCCLALTQCASAAALPNAVAQKVRAATVHVRVEYGDGPNLEFSSGSGILIAPGLVLTNAHIVNEKAPSRITIANEFLPRTPAAVSALRYDDNEFTVASVAEYIAEQIITNANIKGVTVAPRHRNYDIAVLSFTPPPGRRLPHLSFNRAVLRGENVVAAGYPGAANRRAINPSDAYASMPASSMVLSEGVVTNVLDNEPRMIVHSAQCSNGNSGGPVVNARGEVLGMQTWTSIPGGGDAYMALAIGSRDIVAFLEAHGVRPAVSGAITPARPLDAGDRDVRAMVSARADGGDPDYLALAGLLHHLGAGGFRQDDELASAYVFRSLLAGQGHRNEYLYKAAMAAMLIRSPHFNRPDLVDKLLRSANRSDAVSPASRHPDLRLLAFEAALNMQSGLVGMTPRPERSQRLAEKALEGGFALPFALTGYHYYFGGRGGEGRDHARALSNAREAARNGIPEGISLLAHLYYDSDVIPRTTENLRLARRLAEEAMGMGDGWSYGLLANIRYDGGTREDRAAAAELTRQGLRYGNRMAVYCLARIAWDRFLSGGRDLEMAGRAWGYAELAESQGVRLRLPRGAGGGVLRSSGEMLGLFSPAERERVVREGRLEQRSLVNGDDVRTLAR